MRSTGKQLLFMYNTFAVFREAFLLITASIVELESRYPNLSWRYLPSSLFVLYQFNVAALTDRREIKHNCRDATLSSFYGFVNHL